MMMAKDVVAKRATCPRRQVGAVLVRDKRIITTGYNGSPSGMPHCTEVGCRLHEGHCIRAIHAEQNAIVQAALYGVSTRGATCYVTAAPCVTCANLLVAAGIVRVVYGEVHESPRRTGALEAGVKLERFPFAESHEE